MTRENCLKKCILYSGLQGESHSSKALVEGALERLPEDGVVVCSDPSIRIELQSTLPSHLHLRPSNMLLAEEKLAVQVTHLNRIQVNLQE